MKKPKPWPSLKSDVEAERFVAEADLAEYDWSKLEPSPFEFQRKDARIELRLPLAQLNALKRAADEAGIPYTRLARRFIDAGLRAAD